MEPRQAAWGWAAGAELVGAGPLAAALADPDVTDVLVNGPDEVWIDRGAGLERTHLRFADDEEVRRLAVGLAAAAGRRLDAAAPFTDALLPDGTRLHAVLAPTAAAGTCLSLRRPRRRPFTLPQFVASAGAHPALADLFAALVAARLAVVVTGGTGTGKTTLLAALLAEVDPAQRIVLVEDTAELALPRVNLVRLQGRPPNIEGAGEITQRDLVRQALRMRPDRLVVGEVRGPEVLDLLVAFNTGHEGGCTTVHANAAGALPARLEALGSLAGLSRPAVHSHLAAAIDVAIHLRRDSSGRRWIDTVGVLCREPDGLVRVEPALLTRPAGGGPGAPYQRPLPASGLPRLCALLHDRGITPPASCWARP
ncbi:MAG: TadA family conjugal transfer-associated ATPase [Frankia sp.]|nr:TadA family conjugal transfer-associated ATPase [Frankia sp.]